MKKLLLALLVLQVGCTQPTYYAGPDALATQDATICPSFTGTTTVSWSRPKAWAHVKVGVSRNGLPPFTPVVDETKVPSGYFYRVIDKDGQPLPLLPPRCTKANLHMYVLKCEDATIRVVDEAGRGLANMSVINGGVQYYRYGYTDQDGHLSACLFVRGESFVHGPGVLLKRRDGQTFVMGPAQHRVVTVVDEDGRTLAGVEVVVRGRLMVPDRIMTRTDDNGVARLEVDPASIRHSTLEFRRPGYATTRIGGLQKLGAQVTLRPARVVHVVPATDHDLQGRNMSCGTFERDRLYTCKQGSDSWVCECPIGPANLFVDYHTFAVAAEATAVSLDLSSARNGIRGKIRDWQEGCELQSRRDGHHVGVRVNEDGTFAHPALAPSLEHWLELECPDGNRKIKHGRLSWHWLDLGEI